MTHFLAERADLSSHAYGGRPFPVLVEQLITVGGIRQALFEFLDLDSLGLDGRLGIGKLRSSRSFLQLQIRDLAPCLLEIPIQFEFPV